MVEVDGVTWFYVSRPNFAEPVNYKGWIKEEDTVPYTADKVKLVKRPVHVKANTPLYYCDSISDIDKTEPQKYDYQIHCSISEIKDGYALIDLGGSSYWVKERAVIYPEVD